MVNHIHSAVTIRRGCTDDQDAGVMIAVLLGIIFIGMVVFLSALIVGADYEDQ